MRQGSWRGLKVGSLRLPLGDERRVKRGVVFAAVEIAKRSEEGERLLDRLVAGQAARRLLGTVALGRARGRRPVRHTLAVRGFVGRRAGPFGRVILTFGLPANDGSPVASTKGRACHLPNSCGACPCLLRRPQTKRAQKHRPLAQGRSRLWSRQAEAGRKRLPVGNARRRCGRGHAAACSRRSSSFRAGGRHRSPARSPGRCPRGAGG